MTPLRFWLGNVVVASLLVYFMGDSLTYPLWVPVPFRPEVLALTVAVSFSLLMTLLSRLLPQHRLGRSLAVLSVAVAGVALAGVLCALISPGNLVLAGAVVALATFFQTPLVVIPTFLWALLWTELNFPASGVSHVPADSNPKRAPAGPGGDWIGSTR